MFSIQVFKRVTLCHCLLIYERPKLISGLLKCGLYILYNAVR